MKTNKTIHGYEVCDTTSYIETGSAEPTSRVLDGSSDHGYAAEYVGAGTINGQPPIGYLPVIAVYLFDADMMTCEDAGSWDWEKALINGRIILDVDALSNEQWDSIDH